MRCYAFLLLSVACAHAPEAPSTMEPHHTVTRDQILAWGVQAEEAALVRFQLGDLRQAIELERYSVTAQPTAEKFFTLALYYRAAGERRHAAWVMEAFVHLAPSHPRRNEAERLIAEWRGQAGTCSVVADEPEESPPAWTVFEEHRP